MFKNIMIGTLFTVMIVAAGMTACTAQAAPVVENKPVESIPAAGLEDAAEVSPTLSQPLISTSFTTEEISGLLYMYEEEKLARDVYNAMYAQWSHPVFQNIASSEQTHMDAVQTLFVRYGIPVPETASGSFTDPALQSLYTELMATGSNSLADALKVGATIEEVDIVDLQSRIAQTDKTDILQVYKSLMTGSYNHLRAYVRVVERQTGETYQPQYLTDDLYKGILAGSQGNGRSWGGNGSNAGDTSDRGNGFRGGN